jgi:serine/threonine protein phosphatase PrpC
VLRGRDHVLLGRVSALSEGAAAVALSRGGFDKPYAYVDPNEDCAGFARGAGGVLLAVADAHKGCDASQIAIESLLEGFGAAWTGAAAPATPWPEAAARAVADVHAEVLRRTPCGPHPESRTTLAFALVRPGEDLVAWGSLGDSHVFLAGRDAAQEVAEERDPPAWFVGAALREPDEIGARLHAGSGPAAGRSAVVLVTDGISEQHIGVEHPEQAVAEAVRVAAAARPELRALEAARGLAERAQDAHRSHRAGDNVATAVAWLD